MSNKINDDTPRRTTSNKNLMILYAGQHPTKLHVRVPPYICNYEVTTGYSNLRQVTQVIRSVVAVAYGTNITNFKNFVNITLIAAVAYDTKIINLSLLWPTALTLLVLSINSNFVGWHPT